PATTGLRTIREKPSDFPLVGRSSGHFRTSETASSATSTGAADGRKPAPSCVEASAIVRSVAWRGRVIGLTRPHRGTVPRDRHGADQVLLARGRPRRLDPPHVLVPCLSIRICRRRRALQSV